MTSAIDLGKAYARYRARQGFSQKNPQQWAKCKNLMLHDSQIAYFEVGKKNYEPKSQFWLSLEQFNLALANKEMPPTQNGFDKKTRDRLLDAEPFLTIEGKPAEALDFYAMFIGKKPIPEEYKTRNINNELAKRYTKLLREEFHNTRRELMVTGKEVIEKLCNTNIGKKVLKKDVQFLIDVITEEKEFSSKHLQYLIDEYETLPCLAAIQENTKSPKLEKFKNELGIK